MKIDFDVRSIESRITQTGEKAMKGMSDVMRRRAQMIRDLARSYAPVKTGVLEKNIEYVTLKDARRRNAYLVYIDGDAKRVGKRSGSLSEYAKLMEQGKYNLGPGSRKKAMAGNKVGRKFFARAVREGTLLLKEELQAVARGKPAAFVQLKNAYRPATQTARSRTRKRKTR
ncbi:hypothetical protein ATN89_17480 [Comamonas thiooxydans]|nr:hypothetical protein ATN89_17480 [Comamonas thiooxydans]